MSALMAFDEATGFSSSLKKPSFQLNLELSSRGRAFAAALAMSLNIPLEGLAQDRSRINLSKPSFLRNGTLSMIEKGLSGLRIV